jgi:polyisoprenoid-binding protein YceI/mono/diheme cytochrome c family protein
MSRFGAAWMVAVSLWAGAAQASSWVVAPRPHGEVTFKVEGPLDDVTGITRSVTGTLELDEKDWSKGKGVVSVQLDTLRTGIDQRDQDMRVEFLQTERYPYAILAIDRIDRPSAAALAPGQTVQGEAVGSFEIHGVRRAIRIAVTVALETAKQLRVKGSLEVPFSDYAITRPQRLFLKLGETADATFDVLFQLKEGPPTPAPEVSKGTPAPPAAPTVAEVQPQAAKARPRPVKKPAPGPKVAMLFSAGDARAKGEELFHSTQIAGVGSKLACASCHAKADERQGLVQADKYARAASSVWNSGQRGVYWGGMTTDVGKAASICQKRFMLGGGLSSQQEKELKAFLEAVSPDPAPPLDYAGFYKTLQSPVRDPIGGNALKGKEVSDRFCQSCHDYGRSAPPLLQGLYEPEWLVRRVRWLEGHQSQGCPPTSMTRLTDSDLRDVVTYLAGPAAGAPIFKRKK